MSRKRSSQPTIITIEEEADADMPETSEKGEVVEGENLGSSLPTVTTTEEEADMPETSEKCEVIVKINPESNPPAIKTTLDEAHIRETGKDSSSDENQNYFLWKGSNMRNQGT